jgi:hypothetical protein
MNPNNSFERLMDIDDDRWMHAKMDGQIGNRLNRYMDR